MARGQALLSVLLSVEDVFYIKYSVYILKIV